MVIRRHGHYFKTFDVKPCLYYLNGNFPKSGSPQVNLISYPILRHVHQGRVQQDMSPGAAETLKLQSMITNREAPSLIFQHISSNAGLKVSSELVETYLFSLLSSDNLNAVVSLVHILFSSDSKHYKLSNQFWSLITSKAGSLAHHGAASLVYHEIINPFINFFDRDEISEENEEIPFLISPSSIENLAIVFAHNGNHVAIEGLRQYFKRFYSNFGHRDVYHTLYITKVESLANAGLFLKALDTFISLAIKYRGNLRDRDPKDSSHSLKYASYTNYRKRWVNISRNTYIEDNGILDAGNSEKSFRPIVKFNDYTIESGPYWAIFDGFLDVTELPTFRRLLCDQIQELASRSGSVVDLLLAFIAKNHHSMSKFVIVCLCDLGYCLEAIAVANKVPSLFPKLRADNYISAYEFCCIFKALGREFEARNFQRNQEYHSMLIESYKFYESLDLNDAMPSTCFRSFMNCYFLSPLANMDEMTRLSKSWRTSGQKPITINQDVYTRALSLGLHSSELQEFVSCK
ncbi:hypothetical protein JCM33374_g220 [Metschnikowia sp. JCM 33374]|nr:hypothetical protein JCM33374_g220 [Metschnikowia sp. JCM 33374]